MSRSAGSLRVAMVAGTLARGGAEKQFVYMVRALKADGVDVRVFALTRGEHHEAALVREIRNPHEWIPPAYETVTVVTKDGQKIRGIKKNEDAFSIQVMDMRERIQGYLKSNAEVTLEKTSLMPAFDAKRLPDSDLTDLVGYLSTLRGGDFTTVR